MNKEELRTTAKKMLELKEPVLVPLLAPKLAKRVQVIYIICLVFLALTVLFSLISLFTSFSAAIFGLIFVVVEAVVLRMFCEFLLSCEEKQQ